MTRTGREQEPGMDLSHPWEREKERPGPLRYAFLFAFVFLVWHFTVLLHEFVLGITHDRTYLTLASYSVFLGIGSGWPVVGYYKIRNKWAAGCTTFAAALLGCAIPLHAIYEREKANFTEADWIRLEALWPMYVMGVFMAGLAPAVLAAYRADCLFSEKTGQWLASYKAKKLFLEKTKEAKNLAFDDVLNMKTTRKRKNAYSPILYLDEIPEGEHFLRLDDNSKPSFFSTKLGKGRRVALFPIDWTQATAIQEKFGKFKKTRILVPAYARETAQWADGGRATK